MSEAQPPLDFPTPNPAVPARAADGDREAVAERLRVAAGDGRINLVELEERLERAFAAKTYGELDELVADLPPGRSAPTVLDALASPETLVLDTTVSNINLKQSGRWIVPRRIVAKCTRSLIRIDFHPGLVRASRGDGRGHVRDRLDHLDRAARLGGADRPPQHQHRQHPSQGGRTGGSRRPHAERHRPSPAWLCEN
jgi:hypothetical protein